MHIFASMIVGCNQQNKKWIHSSLAELAVL
jgi:hypothetical protein